MKNYADSDYALNKHSKNIVYRFSDGIVEVTLADFLRENPGKNESDFQALKAISDADYLEQSKSNYRQTRKNIGYIEGDIGIQSSETSMETKIISIAEKENGACRLREIAIASLDTLTEKQRRRYLMHRIGGLSSWKIAVIEGLNQKTIHESLIAAEKKIQKFTKSSQKNTPSKPRKNHT